MAITDTLAIGPPRLQGIAASDCQRVMLNRSVWNAIGVTSVRNELVLEVSGNAEVCAWCSPPHRRRYNEHRILMKCVN